MNSLLLIRHSKPDTSSPTADADWPLSAEGRDLCAPLAELLRTFAVDRLVSSPMLRARQTAELLAGYLGIRWEVEAGLAEHRRPMVSEGEFLSLIEALFANPSERVFGDSAGETLDRFRSAVDASLSLHSGSNLGIVSHATVMSLYAASCFGITPWALWRAIGQPCVLVIDRDTGRGLRIIDSLT